MQRREHDRKFTSKWMTALAENNTLTSLELRVCMVQLQAQMFELIAATKDCCLTSKTCGDLCSALKDNKTLTELVIDASNIR